MKDTIVKHNALKEEYNVIRSVKELASKMDYEGLNICKIYEKSIEDKQTLIK